MEILTIIKDKYFRRETNKDRLRVRQVTEHLESLCKDYLQVGEDVLTFEAMEDTLPFVIEVFDDTSFMERYKVNQLTNSVFEIRLRVIDLL